MIFGKVGLEKEYYVVKRGEFTLASSGIGHDDCGYLAEARGEPHDDPLKAVYLLLADEDKLKSAAAKLKVGQLKVQAYNTLPQELINLAVRTFGKSANTIRQERRGNLYGLGYSGKEPTTFTRAGVHIHFSPTLHTVEAEEGPVTELDDILDIPKIIQGLDKAFSPEINAAKRIIGEYEMKPEHHGFEYRSLPATVDLKKVAKVLVQLKYRC